ncbi:Uncharacterised protein [Mycobacteroides abscessus subsp. abscessus]|nr:Uncharacterised protein [Mycobacteroides abscessus subsp. abscessus]
MLGHRTAVGPALIALVFAPFLFVSGVFLGLCFLGRWARDNQLEAVDRTVLGDIVVVESVQVGAELLADFQRLPSALGRDHRLRGVAQLDQRTCFAQTGFRCALFHPCVAGPPLDTAGGLVVPQGVRDGSFCPVGGGEQARIEHGRVNVDQRFWGGREASPETLGVLDDGAEPVTDLRGELVAGSLPHHLEGR